MKTLLVMCLIRLSTGEVEVLRGNEYVYMERGGKIAVAFESLGLQYVPENDCTYLEDPTIVSRHPERYYPKFQKDCGPRADKLWRETSLLTYAQACKIVKGAL